MTDKKPTDKEIVKALECCSINKKCTGCYFNTHKTDDMCPRVLMRNALDLINYQKAELNKYDNIKALLDMFYNTLLKIGIAKGNDETFTLEEFAEAIQEIKAEA